MFQTRDKPEQGMRYQFFVSSELKFPEQSHRTGSLGGPSIFRLQYSLDPKYADSDVTNSNAVEG